MKKKIIGILVCMLLIATAGSAVGTINKTVDEKMTAPFSQINTPIRTMEQSFFQGKCVLWDNTIFYAKYGIHAQDDPPETPSQWDSFEADDFQFDENTNVYWVYWIMGYYSCNYAQGPKDYHFDWNITFYADDGSGNRPGAVYASLTIADADLYRAELWNSTTAGGCWLSGMGAVFSEPVTFLSGTKYWISIYSIDSHYPQSAWYLHNETWGGIRLHQALFKSAHWGFPSWTNISEVDEDGETCDMGFLLGGELLPIEITLKKGLGITATIKNLLPEPYNLTNVTVTFSLTGGFVFNRIKTFFIEFFNVSATETMKFYPIGFGRITIEVTALSKEAIPGRINTSGFLFLFLMI